MRDMLERYKEACNYPGVIDDASVERHLAEYLAALKIDRKIVQITRCWDLSEDKYAPWRGAVNEVFDAIDARVALDARDARVAIDARVARDALVARVALDARDTRAVAEWVASSSGWWRWDVSWISVTAIGARHIKAGASSAWAGPLFEAFCSGCYLLFWTNQTLYWVAKPTMKYAVGTRQLHCENGPAISDGLCDYYYWRGVVVPEEWITRKHELTPTMALAWNNLEQRRAACEIVGWDRILGELKAVTIDKDEDPMVGELIEADIPNIGNQRFLRVRCGTGRQFTVRVSRAAKTALEANARSYRVSQDLLKQLEVRT